MIDDCDDDGFFVRREFRKGGIGAKLLCFERGNAALNYFERSGAFSDREQYPDTDLIFLDLNMPQVSGFDLLAWLKAHRSTHSPLVVVMTSSADASDRHRAMTLGADSYCSKPPTKDIFSVLAEELKIEWIK